MKISVTQKDIRYGVRKQESSCPVALAIRAKGITRVHIDGYKVQGKYKGRFISADLPMRAKVFVKRFDRAEEVRPFQFTLNL